MSNKNEWFQTNLNQRSPTNLCDFEVYFNKCDFEKKPFDVISKEVAKDIHDSYDNLYLTYSGGLDSEFVLKTFYDLKLNITPVIVVTPYNLVECKYAFKFCNERKIRYETLVYNKEEILKLLYSKTQPRGWFSLLGALPLIVCDEVNKVGGKLLTGYGETSVSSRNLDGKRNKDLELCEWDFYLDCYDSSHPSAFFTYDKSLFYSLINDINYDVSPQQAKYELYGLEPRPKMYWSDDFYQIFNSVKLNVSKFECLMQLDDVNKILDDTV